MKIATIDIGTHSVLLLIAEKKKGSTTPLVDEANLTRIGEGMGRTTDHGQWTMDNGPTAVFLPSAMERTLAVLKKYKTICSQQGVDKILAVGTAAFRKAKNASDFVAQVKKDCGIEIEIISGEREAALTWKAASTDFGKDILVVDIGGGSTEIVVSHQGSVVSHSIEIGSVLLTERYVHSDPISETDYQTLCQTIDQQLESLDLRTLRHSSGQAYRLTDPSTQLRAGLRTLVATAGTATTLGAIQKKMRVYQHAEIHGMKLTLNELQTIIADFKSKTIAERKKIPGLEPGRADVILAGSLLLQKIAEHFGFQEITVSDRGVRWGLVYEQLD